VGLGQKTSMEWFLALGIAKHKKSLKNPMRVPSHFKDRDNDEKVQ
jgi:hypothetical protein